MASGLSGSTIKSWFQYRCERKTRYETMDPAELAAVPVAKDNRENRWAILGVDFEERVVQRLSQEKVVLRPPKGDKEGLREGLAAEFLRGRGNADYAAQLKLKPRLRPAWLGNNLELRRSFADLVCRTTVRGKANFRIIDVKATRSARAFHKMQVAFYALLLDAVINENAIVGEIDPEGEIWRIPDDGDAEGDRWQVESFAIEPYKRLVREFCANTLSEIASKPVRPGQDETFFHVYFKCEQCAYLPHCIQAVDRDRPAYLRDVSAVPGLSHEAKRTLISMGGKTVAQLAEMGAGIGRMDGAGWSLSRRAETLIARAQAMRDDKVAPGSESHTFLMPPRTDAALYLAADQDPVDDGLVTLGYLYVRGDITRQLIKVLPTADRKAEANALVEIFSQLISDLREIDAHNASLPGGPSNPASIFSHIFVYEAAEGVGLQNAVKRHLDDPRVRHGLLDMVRLFPPDEIVPEPEFRGMQHLPATALRSVIEQLFALPVTVSYDLRQVSDALQRNGFIGNAYSPNDLFHRPFSSLLSIDVSRALREGRPGCPTIDQIESDVAARLQATHAAAEWLRSEHRRRIQAGERAMLRLNKQPFRMQATFDPLAVADLDMLRAFELLENRSGLLETMIKLAQPTRVRREAGRAIGPMRLLNVYKYARSVVIFLSAPPDALDDEIAAGAFGLILSNGEPEYVLEPRMWPQISCELLDPKPNDTTNLRRVRVFRPNFESAVFQEMMRRIGEEGWFLDRSFVDLNTAKADNFISFLAQSGAA
ncbi:hypothetical protein C7G42_14790 [Bradyrhizobium sp. MOS003]|nr:hypothetical protein C7G42_14790 [Bradyrhizobium sp. MOS003]